LSAYLTATNQLRIVKIVAVKKETANVKSFTFHEKTASYASPGQFVMIWIPGVDEIPMSLSMTNPEQNTITISVEKVGEATRRLHKMRVGGLVGIRGPFGRGYRVTDNLKTGAIMIAAGGTGVVSLAPLCEHLVKNKNCRVTFLLGAKTRSELLYMERIKNTLDNKKHRLIVTTDDGSYGEKGLVTRFSESILANERFDSVFACGPEVMMHKMLMLCERFNVPFQASLERFMRCAIGICGTCVIGKYRVCRDGPVFSGEELWTVKEEFGKFKRGIDGRKIDFHSVYDGRLTA
jgi:dihydroorotate dehydrogenase electron transfer subunit